MSEKGVAKILQFKPLVECEKGRKFVGGARQKEQEVVACKSPILIDWLNRLSFAVSFHKNYFDIPLIDNVLVGLNYGETNTWKLYWMDDPMDPSYVSYLVILQDFHNENAAKIMAAIVDRMIREAYLEEIRALEAGVNTYDLAKPYHVKLGEGATISGKTRAALLAAHMKTGRDLMQLTREQICAIPGMTTGEVVALEKSLAMRGLFLRTPAPKL